jgi:hypothetical protein
MASTLSRISHQHQRIVLCAIRNAYASGGDVLDAQRLVVLAEVTQAGWPLGASPGEVSVAV